MDYLTESHDFDPKTRYAHDLSWNIYLYHFAE